MAALQYRLSSRVSHGMSEVLVRFYDGEQGFRAKGRVYCPVSEWDASDGMPRVSKRVTPQSIAATAARMKMEQIRSVVFARWLDERKYANAEWLQDVIDDIIIRKNPARL